MRNRTYGGVRGRKTKVGRKLLRFPPTRLYLILYVPLCQIKSGTDMQRNTKDWIHYSSAGIVLLAGIVLVYISFFMSHDVTSNVLWYFGQSLVYVATVFGFALTFDTRVKDIINKYFNNKNGTQD